MTAVAAAWGRRKRRLSWLVAIGTLALTAISIPIFTMPTWRKLAARNWPIMPARVEKVTQHFNDGRAWIFEGSKLTMTFSYVALDRLPHEATQDVSAAFGRERLGIGDSGYVMFGDPRADAATCSVDPADATVAVLQTSLGHADVPALMPLVVLIFGGLMFVAERRNAASADDLAARVRSRNGQRWRLDATNGRLAATAAADVTPDAMLFTALVNWPALAVRVAPHPAALGEAMVVELSFTSRRRWQRRLRVKLMLGPFNGSGGTRHARWSADVFDGQLAPDQLIRKTIRLPRAGDLPPGVDDCWLRITARTLIGLPWSRTLWIALNDSGGR